MDWLIGKTGLHGHVQRNRARVAFLYLGFLVAAELVVLPIMAVGSLFFDPKTSFLLQPLAFLLKYSPIVAVGASVLFLVRWWRFPVAVGARLAARDGTPACRRIQRLARELAILNGIPEPRTVMIESVARNAFAAGMTNRNATIVVTTGLEAALSDAELKAVLAHEMAHIAFGDTRVMAASAVMVDTLDAMRRFSPWKNGLGWKTGLFAIFMPIVIFLGMALAALSAIADTIGRGTRLFVASSREMIADAEAIRLTHNPGALVSALGKIDGRSGIGTFPRAIEAMMIDGLASGAEATHPTIAERIRAITDLTGEHFPLPAAAVMPARKRPVAAVPNKSSPARTLFGIGSAKRPAEPGFVEEAFAQTVFGRVREGQGNLVKKSRGFQIAVGVGVGLFALSYLSAISSFKKLETEDGKRATPDIASVSPAVTETREAYSETNGVFRYDSGASVTPAAGKTQPADPAAEDSRVLPAMPSLRGAQP